MTPGAPTGMLRRGRNWPARMLGAGLLAAIAPSLHAQHADAWVPGKGHGAVSIAYQDLYIRYHTDSHGNKQLPGTIDNHGVFLDLDYGLTDTLALSVGLPFKSNRFDERIPGSRHDPGHQDDGHGEHFIDDGRYHGGWADWNLGLRYQWRSEPWSITPFVSYGVPSRDYTTFAHSAVGTGQQRLELGVNTGHRFAAPRQNLYFQGGISYAWMEVVDRRRVNHGSLNLELGYFVTPRLSARLSLVGQKTWNGLDFPEDYPPPRNDEHFFHHDENLRNDFVNIGAGVDYQLGERYSLFAAYGHTLWGENAHLIDYAVSVGVSRGF